MDAVVSDNEIYQLAYGQLIKAASCTRAAGSRQQAALLCTSLSTQWMVLLRGICFITTVHPHMRGCLLHSMAAC
jgi:hypothetical protein